MYRIKIERDLKELEKFGFELDNDDWYIKKDKGIIVFIKPSSRKIGLNTEGLREKIAILYDLIQAGLVEKVEE